MKSSVKEFIAHSRRFREQTPHLKKGSAGRKAMAAGIKRARKAPLASRGLQAKLTTIHAVEKK